MRNLTFIFFISLNILSAQEVLRIDEIELSILSMSWADRILTDRTNMKINFFIKNQV